MTPAARQRWSIGAILGIIVGELILITGDRSGNHGIRLLGALTVYSSNRTEYGVDQQRLLKESAAILTNALRAISEKVVIAPDLAGDLILLEQNSPLPPHETSLESELTH